MSLDVINGETTVAEQTLTSHDMARNLQLTANWLLSRPAFAVSSQPYAESYNYVFFWEKQPFLQAVRAIGAGKKRFTDAGIDFIAEIPGGRITLSAPRNLVCRVVRTAETKDEQVTQTVTRTVREAEYECEPLLSEAELQELGGAR